MKLPVLILAASLAVAGCGSAGPRCATADAQGIVTALQPEKQFRSMLESTVERTQTARMAERRDGPSADPAIAAALDKAVARHKAAWEQNLAKSWNTLTPEQIGRACDAMAARDEATFMLFLHTVGVKALQLNEPLMKQAAAEVLAEV